MFKATVNRKKILSEMLRVDHAGEIGANFIYKGQAAILNRDTETKEIIQHMWDQEKHHLNVFDDILAKSRVRPSLLRPFWEVAGYTLGVTTALMGKEAAFACTEAVETVIGQHYNDQIRTLLEMDPENPEIKKLVAVLSEFRDDEFEHLDKAVEMDSSKAPFYEILKQTIQIGCKTAIQIAKKL